MFFVGIDYTNNVFDIMALAYDKLGTYSPSLLEDYDPGCYTELFDLFESYAENQDYSSFFSFKQLKEELNRWANEKDISQAHFLAIIDAIDKHVVYDYPVLDVFFREYNTIEAISSQHKNKKIFPKMQSTLTSAINQLMIENEEALGISPPNCGFRKQKDYAPGTINEFLENYIIVDEADIGYSIIMHQLADNNEFSKKILTNRSFNIALFPLINTDSRLVLDKAIKGKAFSINEIKPEIESVLINRYFEAIDVCCNKEIHIAIFPEMLLTETILNKITDKIKATSPQILPEILILGTVWANRSNKCVVISKFGNIVFEQHKHSPYRQGNCFEDLSLDNKEINVIDINGIGRIFTHICRDIDNDKLMNATKILDGDFVFLPAFTPSLDLVDASKTLAARYLCSTVMCNTCSALSFSEKKVKEEKNIGYVCIPAKKDTERASKVYNYSFNSQCLNCKKYCGGWLAQMDFSRLDAEYKTYSIDLHKI